jgi:hypothetical protein
MTLIACGDDGSAGACAQAGVARASATKSAAAHRRKFSLLTRQQLGIPAR